MPNLQEFHCDALKRIKWVNFLHNAFQQLVNEGKLHVRRACDGFAMPLIVATTPQKNLAKCTACMQLRNVQVAVITNKNDPFAPFRGLSSRQELLGGVQGAGR